MSREKRPRVVLRPSELFAAPPVHHPYRRACDFIPPPAADYVMKRGIADLLAGDD